MLTRQTIAVIGVEGKELPAICKHLSKGNYKLVLYAEEADGALFLMNEILTADPSADVEAMDCSVNAGWEADIIIMSVSPAQEKEIAEKIKKVANQKIIIRVNELLTISDTDSEKALQKLLPNSKLITLLHNRLAGEDADALQTVSGLLAMEGFQTVKRGR